MFKTLETTCMKCVRSMETRFRGKRYSIPMFLEFFNPYDHQKKILCQTVKIFCAKLAEFPLVWILSAPVWK